MSNGGIYSFIGNELHRTMWRSMISMMPDGIPDGMHLIIWDWAWREDWQLIHERFPFDEYSGLITSNPRHYPVLLIDSMNEAPQYQTHIAPLVDFLDETGVTPRDDVMHCTGSASRNQGVTKIQSNGAFALGYCDSEIPERWNHHFIMLSRVPKPLRVICSSEVLRRGLDNRGYISCGVNTHASIDRTWIERFVHHELRHRFPLSIDDASILDFSQKQFEITDPRITGAALNVITETSQDRELEVSDPFSVWNDVFITEKTAKAFRLLQLPIWAAVCGTVDEARRMGFDVFDDVIDHGYDMEQDPYIRMSMVADQIGRICNRGMDELNDMRRAIWSRLLYNRKLAGEISNGLLANISRDLGDNLCRISSRHQ